MQPSSHSAAAQPPALSTEPEGAERPKVEPEIIPPGAEIPWTRPDGSFVFARHGARIHVTRLRPVGIASVLIGGAVLAAFGVLMLLGAVLVCAAALGVVFVGALIARLLHGLRK